MSVILAALFGAIVGTLAGVAGGFVAANNAITRLIDHDPDFRNAMRRRLWEGEPQPEQPAIDPAVLRPGEAPE